MHSLIGKLMKRTRGSRSWSVSQPVTALARPFLPWKPWRVATIMSRARSRASAAHSAFWIASEPDAAHITCSSRFPPGRSCNTSINRRVVSISSSVTALYAVRGTALENPLGASLWCAAG